jgi:MFS family permease
LADANDGNDAKDAGADNAGATNAGGWYELTHGAGLVRLALIMSCVSLHAMDVFVTSTILPSVVEDIDGVAFYAWPSALYIITSIMGAASGGMVGANLGLRRALGVASIVYLLGSIVCAIAPHMAVFLMGRTAQGVGAGLLVALAYTMVRQLFDDDQRPRVFAFMSAIWGVGALLGPLFAGAFAQMGFWRGVYWLILPIVVIMWVLARRALPVHTPMSGGNQLPWARLFLLGAAVLCVTVSGQSTEAMVRVILILGALLGVAGMLWLDHVAENSLLPSWPTSFRHTVGTGYWIFFLMSLSFAPLGIFLPLLAQRLHGVEPIWAGYVSAVLSLGWSTGSFVAAGASQPMQRVLIVTGPLCLLVGIAGQGMFIATGPLLPLILLIFLAGLGIGQCHVHVSNRVMSTAREGEESLTAGAIPTMQSLGIAFGAATAGLLANVAGLSGGISVATLTEVTEWIYGFALIPAACTVLVALHLVRLIRSTASTS